MGENRQSKTTQHHFLEESAEQALFGLSSLQPPLDGMVATFHSNERPLQGLAGLLDWRFHGAISAYLRAGALSGQEGECAYVPISRNGRIFHLILLGAGASPGPGVRQALDEKVLKTLRDNVRTLGIPRLGISRLDLGNASREFFSKQLKEVPLWIVP